MYGLYSAFYVEWREAGGDGHHHRAGAAAEADHSQTGLVSSFRTAQGSHST